MRKYIQKASFLSISIAAAAIVAGCASGFNTATYSSPQQWVEASKKESHLPLAAKADEWSEKKVMATKNGGSLGIRSQFVKQHGTTCHYNVEFSNEGQTEIRGTAGLSRDWKREVYSHNSGRLNLKPGQKTAYNDLEARECPLQWGTTKDMAVCASCLTTILLAE